MNNIDQFNQYTAAIFAKLYDAFPVRIELTADDITGIEFDRESLFYENNVQSPKEWDFCVATWEWLKEAGYIWHEGGSSEGWKACYAVLTPKALEALRSTPDTIDSGRTVGDRLREVAKAGSQEMVKQTVQLAMVSALKLINS